MAAQGIANAYIPASKVLAKNGITYAYRRLGTETGVPLVCQIHARATMGYWDPYLIRPLAMRRPVIMFDAPGTGQSSGTEERIPETMQEMADDTIAFLDAIELKLLDYLAFSIGSQCGQLVALTIPQRIRCLILVGCDPSAPLVEDEVYPRGAPAMERFKHLTDASTDEGWILGYEMSFFRDNDQGRAACDAYFKRLLPSEFNDNGHDGRIPSFLGVLGFMRQIQAIRDWWTPKDREATGRSFYRLAELKMPILIMTGDLDYLVPTERSFELMSQVDNAQLVIWPQAGHASIFQYPENNAYRINEFLDSDPENWKEPRL